MARRAKQGVAATVAVLATAGAMAFSAPAGAHGYGSGRPAYTATKLGGSFLTTTDIAYTSADPNDLFVVQQIGRIDLQIGGTRPAGQQPFLDISDDVLSTEDENGGNEQGLLAMAFAPDYAESGLFYVYFTNNDGAVEVDQFQVSPNRKIADPASRKVIIVIPHTEAQSHNGADLAFGPDGHLYLAPGDADSEGALSQDDTSLLGKVLRIDPNRAGGYTVPASNPFVGSPGADEIYAMGLRNPYRLSIDPITHSLAIGDVGETGYEEIDFSSLRAAKGANYGWPRFEGTHDFDPSYSIPESYRAPILDYSHIGGRCVVTAGLVVHTPKLPDLDGRFVYADLCLGHLRSFDPDRRANEALGDHPLHVHVPYPVAFTEGPHGCLYVASTKGLVYKIKGKASGAA